MQLRTSVQKKLDMAKVLLSQGASANGFNKVMARLHADDVFSEGTVARAVQDCIDGFLRL
jgi:hypothetical protein